MKILKLALILVAFSTLTLQAQETLPVYSDYLSDNVYLLHPAAAGVGNCAKLRLTHRAQWTDSNEAPSLQTLSYHSRVSGDSNVGLGGIVFNDRNGYHSQFGALATFAYHIDMGGANLNQLSFALSGMFTQNKLDESNFILPGQLNDPVITNLVLSENYYNADFGMAYHYKTGFAYLTVKNLLLSARGLNSSSYESLNLRRYLFSLGYFFDNENPNKIKLEPSVMAQLIEYNSSLTFDFNLKAYRKLANDNILWAAVSYRQGFDGNNIQELSQFTPIIGINLKNVLISYTYTHQVGKITFANGGFHQFTLGLDVFCKEPRLAACPNINSAFR